MCLLADLRQGTLRHLAGEPIRQLRRQVRPRGRRSRLPRRPGGPHLQQSGQQSPSHLLPHRPRPPAARKTMLPPAPLAPFPAQKLDPTSRGPRTAVEQNIPSLRDTSVVEPAVTLSEPPVPLVPSPTDRRTVPANDPPAAAPVVRMSVTQTCRQQRSLVASAIGPLVVPLGAVDAATSPLCPAVPTGFSELRATVPPGPLCSSTTSEDDLLLLLTPACRGFAAHAEMPPPMLPGLLRLVHRSTHLRSPLPAALWPTVRMTEPPLPEMASPDSRSILPLESQQMSQSGQQFERNQRSRLQSGYFPNLLMTDQPDRFSAVSTPIAPPGFPGPSSGSALKERAPEIEMPAFVSSPEPPETVCACLLGLKSDRSTQSLAPDSRKNRSRAVPVPVPPCHS